MSARVTATWMLLLAIIVAGCTAGPTTPPAGTPAGAAPSGATAAPAAPAAAAAATPSGASPTAAPQKGGNLRIGVYEDLQSLDAHRTVSGTSEAFLSAVFPTLLLFDKNLGYVPGLATKWEVSPDLLAYTFHLRPDAKFTNGRAVTAADVKWNYERILKPDTGSLLASVLPIASVETPDASTVVFRMKAANADQLYYINWPGRAGIMAPESVNDKNALTTPIGSGPFKVKDFKPGVSLTLEKNTAWWEALPASDTVQALVLMDPSARVAALAAGEIDVALNAPAEVSAQKNLVVQEVFDNTASQWSINTRRPPFDKVAIRQAMQLALSRKDIADAAWSGAAVPVDSIFSERSPWYPRRTFATTADLAKAQQLIKDSGVDISQVTVTLKHLDPFQQQEVQLVAASWKKLGFKDVVLKQMQSAKVVDEISAADWDAIVFKPSSVNVPDRQYTYFDPGSGWRFGLSGFLESAEVQRLLQDARVSSDVALRKKNYLAVDQIGNVEQSSQFFTVRPKFLNAMKPTVKDWNQSENATLWTWWMRGGMLTAYVSP